MNRLLTLLVFLLAATVARDAQAEVMDKEPSLYEIFAWAIIGGGLGFVAWRFRWWLGLVATVFIVPYFIALHRELRDPFAGPAIRAEAGLVYVWGAHVATVLFVAAHILGSGLWLRRRRRLTSR